MVKWQYGAVSSVVGIAFIFSIVLNLSGISYQTDGDKVCTDCYSKIEVNSTYWNVCVEHAGNKTAIFKKTPTSRVLYINLDKINEVITTNPEIKTELLVQTIKSKAEFTSEEFGYLRNVKDGDCIIERINKPNKFYIHGNKLPEQQVKWSFDVESATIEDINIDPIWLADIEITPIKECITSTIVSTKQVRGICTTSSSSVYIDNQTKKNSTFIQYYNSTCEKSTYLYYANTTNCRTIGYTFCNKKVLFEKQDKFCYINGNFLECLPNFEGNNCLGQNSGKNCERFNLIDCSVTSKLDTNSIKAVEIEN